MQSRDTPIKTDHNYRPPKADYIAALTFKFVSKTTTKRSIKIGCHRTHDRDGALKGWT